MTDTMEVFSNISNEDMTGQVRLPGICRQYRNDDNRQGYKAWWQKARALPRDVKEDGANISLNSQRNKNNHDYYRRILCIGEKSQK